MENELNHQEELTPQPEHILYPEYTPEYPDVSFFQESYVTMREENIFHGEIPPEERNTAEDRREKQKKRRRWAWLQRLLGSALRGGAALFALSALVLGAVSLKEPEAESPAARIKVLAADLHKVPFTAPDDYTAKELAALWRGDPMAPHQYDFDHLIVLKEATCRENGASAYICTECGVHLVYPTMKDHEPSAPVRENIVKPDCIHEGSCEEVIICEACGEELSREPKVLAALGHTGGDPVIGNVTEPDCTHEGSQEEIIYCTVCGEEISRETVILAALGHTEGEAVIENIIEPSCTEEGSQEEVIYCADCGEELSRTTVVLDALGHTEDEAVIENEVEPGCTEEGSQEEVVYCAVCGEELSRTTVVLDALGHTEDEAVVENEVEPGCTEEGSFDEVVYCAVCGEELSRTTETSPALGHSYAAKATAATCTERGYTTHTCSRCGDSYRDTYTAALGHSYSNKTTAPTCTARGYITHTCSRCGDSYQDNFTAALGHTRGNAVTENSRAASCTANGSYDEVVYCSVCRAEISRTTVSVPALGHTYTAGVTNATCTAQGYTTHTCSRCGDSYRDTYTAALGHSFSIDGSSTWNNTTPQTCSRCGTYALTITQVNATTFSYSINTDFWNLARSMGLGFFEWGDCVVYADGVGVGYISSNYNVASSASGTFVLDFVPESGKTYEYQLRLRVSASTSSDDVTLVYPQGGQFRTYTAP